MTFLIANIFVNFVNFHFILPNLAACVLAKDIKLDESKTIIRQLTSENQLMVRIHARRSLVIIWHQLGVEVENFLEPHVLRVFVVNLCIETNLDVLVKRNENFNFLIEAAMA